MTEVLGPAANSAGPLEARPAGSPKRRWRRIVAIVVGALALLVATLYATIVLVFPPERLAVLLADEIKKTTGRDFRIDGGLSIRILPTIAVKADNVVLANADWGSRPEMVRVRTATFEVSARALLQRRIRILKIEVEGVDALLETDGTGRVNWQFAPSRSPAVPKPSTENPESGSLALAVDELVLRDVRVGYRAGPAIPPRTLVLETLGLKVEGDRDHLSAAFAFDSHRWTAEGSVGRAEAMLEGARDWPFDLRFATAGTALSAKGTLGTGPRTGALTADVAADLTTTDALTSLGSDIAALPMPLKLAANLRRVGDEILADPLRLTLAGQTIDGRVTVRNAPPRPKIDAELSAATIDVAKLRPGSPDRKAAAPARPPQAALFGDAPLAFGTLPDIELRLALAVRQLDAPGVPALSALQGRVTLVPGRLRIDGLRVGVAGGEARGNVDLHFAADSPPRVDLTLDATSMSIEALDRALNGTSRFHGGRAGLSAKLALAGRTPRQIAASTSGDVVFTASDATLADGTGASLDRNVLMTLLRLLIPQQSTQQALVVECAAVRLPLRRGVAKIDHSIGMETREVAVVASGELNLVDQSVRLEFRPEVKKGLGLNPTSLAQLLMLSGPLQDPRVSVDPKGAARGAATVGVAVATGGLSLLAPTVLNTVKGPQATACGRAATGKPTTERPATEEAPKRAREKKSGLGPFRR